MKEKDHETKIHSSMTGKRMSYRQLKAFIHWAREQGILQLKVDGVEVVFNPAAQFNTAESIQGKVKDLLPKKSKDELLQEEEDLLYASAL